MQQKPGGISPAVGGGGGSSAAPGGPTSSSTVINHQFNSQTATQDLKSAIGIGGPSPAANSSGVVGGGSAVGGSDQLVGGGGPTAPSSFSSSIDYASGIGRYFVG